MSLSDIPFTAITVFALFTHIVSVGLATIVQPVWKRDTSLDQWWTPASFMRLFTVRRDDVRPFTWKCIVLSRVAFGVCVGSLLLNVLFT